ncbi:MAG: hypothetical protein AB7V77_05190, partial [Candidatus Woesearchaeota archaeon]
EPEKNKKETNFLDSDLDFEHDKDLDEIREKLGLNENKSTKHLFDKLEKEANLDLEKEAEEYEKNINQEEQQIEEDKENIDTLEINETTNTQENLTQDIPAEKIENPAPPVKLKNKSKDNVLTLESEFELPEFKLPTKENDDLQTSISAAKEAETKLSKLEKEAKELMLDVKNIILEKKRKHLKNIYVLPDKTHLKSLISLKDYTKSNSKFFVFKETILKDKVAFKKWVDNLLNIEKQTELALTKELYKKVNALYSIYEKKLNSITAKYKPITIKELNAFKQKETFLQKEIEYVKKFKIELEKLKTHTTSLEKKYKTNLLTLEKQKEIYKQKEQERENKYKQKEQERKEFYDKKFNEFNRWMAEQKSAFEKEKQEYEKRENELKEKLLLSNKIAFNLKEKNEKERSKIHPEYINLKEQENEFKTRKEIIEKKLKEQEERLVQKINYNENLLTAIAKEKQNLLKLNEDIEQGGFKNYLNKELSNTITNDIPNSKLDNQVNFKPSMDIADTIHKLIFDCRSFVENNDFLNAKSKYNEIRNAFMNAKFDSQQKNKIYVEIRELYDDININILERDAKEHINQ